MTRTLNSEITVIGSGPTCTGFGLCGIKDIHETTNTISADELNHLVMQSHGDIIIIDQTLVEKVTVQTEKLLVPVPETEDQSRMKRLVQQVVGDIDGYN